MRQGKNKKRKEGVIIIALTALLIFFGVIDISLAAQEQTVQTDSGSFPLDSFWSGVLGESAEIHNINAKYRLSIDPDDFTAPVGLRFNLTNLPIDPTFSIGGGNLEDKTGTGKLLDQLPEPSACTATPVGYTLPDNDAVQFKLCGQTPSLSLSSSNSSVISCSGMSCIAVSSGNATITGNYNQTQFKIWGKRQSDLAWIEVASTNLAGSISWDVQVVPAPTLTFTSAKPNPIDYGTSTDLTWSTSNATTCVASGAWSGTKETSGSFNTGNLYGTKRYTLSCTGDGGTVTRSVDVTVSAPNPAPTLTFTATPSTVAYNTGSTLVWTSTNATACVASGDWSGDQPISGNAWTGNLTSNRTYALTCTGLGGTISRYITISVEPPTSPPPTLTFSASSSSIIEGGSTLLSWDSTNAESCQASGDWGGTKALSGNESTGPLTPGSHTYTLFCSSPFGSISRNVNISVTPLPTLTFSADQENIDYNSSTILRWSSTNTTTCTGTSNGSTANIPLSGQQSTGSLLTTTSYSVTCSGPGGSVTRSVTITVGDPPEPPALSFTVDDPILLANRSTTLRWDSDNTTYCVAGGDWSGLQPIDGSQSTGNLGTTRTYILTCYGASGQFITRSVTIIVVPPPLPSVEFTADNYNIAFNSSTTLHWNSSNATSCTASGGWSGSVGLSGDYNTGALLTSRSYTLTCTGEGGTISRLVTITVGDPPGPPTLDFTADNTNLEYRGFTTLRWNSINAIACVASGSWSGTRPISGTYNTGALTSTRTFILTCTGASGQSVSRSVTIIVAPPGAPTLNFYADNYFVNYNTGTTLRWESTNTSGCTASGAWSGSRGTTGSQATGNLTSSRTYTLTCAGYDGSTITGNVTITVGPIPDPTLTFTAYRNPTNFNTIDYLRWSTTYATACVASSDWGGAKATNSGWVSTGYLTSSKVYILTCTGLNGNSVTSSVTITVNPPTEYTVPPTITQFTADASTVSPGSSTILRWNTSRAHTCLATGDWSGSRNTSGATGTGTLYVTKVYILTCSNNIGSTSASVTVTVPTVGIQLTADTNPLPHNSSTTLRWTTQWADRCTASGDWSGDRPTSGSEFTGNLEQSKRYTLTCSGQYGSASVDLDLTVGPPGAPGPNISFWPDAFIVRNGSGGTTLHWDSPDSNRCVATGDWSIANLPTQGEWTTGPLPDNSTRNYLLTCYNNIGGMTVSVTVRSSNNLNSPGPTLGFWADRINIDPGTFTTLHWVSENATSCVASQDWCAPPADCTKSLAGHENTATLSTGKTYELTCSGPGGSITGQVIVSVGSATTAFPSVEFTADSYTIQSGDTTTLHWRTQNATICYYDSSTLNLSDWPAGTAIPNALLTYGEQVTAPLTETNSYRLRCVGQGGEITAIVTITPLNFVVCPNNALLRTGESVRLRAFYNPSHGINCESAVNAQGQVHPGVQEVTTRTETVWTSSDENKIKIEQRLNSTSGENEIYAIGLNPTGGLPIPVRASFQNVENSSLISVFSTRNCYICDQRSHSCSSIETGNPTCETGQYDTQVQCLDACRSKFHETTNY